MRLVTLVLLVVTVVVGCTGAAPNASSGSPSAGRPTVTIDSPANGAAVTVGQPVNVQVTGIDTAGVSRLDLHVANVLVDSATTPGNAPRPSFSAQLSWMPSAPGSAAVTAVAYRPDGTGSDPASIAVTVTAGGARTAPDTSAAAGGGATRTRAPRPTPTPTRTPPPAPAAAPDLVLASVETSRDWCFCLNTVTFVVRNDGRAAAGPFRVLLSMRSTEESVNVPDLAPGATFSHLINLIVSEGEGTGTLRVTVTPARGETDTRDNAAEREVYVRNTLP